MAYVKKPARTTRNQLVNLAISHHLQNMTLRSAVEHRWHGYCLTTTDRTTNTLVAYLHCLRNPTKERMYTEAADAAGKGTDTLHDDCRLNPQEPTADDGSD